MPRSLARLSASELSRRDLSSAVFITNIAESDFRYTQWVAVNDALKPLGAKILHQPFTPERVLDALARAGGGNFELSANSFARPTLNAF
jgi:hypothetical protein